MFNLWSLLQQTAAAGLTALFLLVLKAVFADKLSPRWQSWVWGVLVLRLLVPVGFGGRSALLDGGWAVDAARVWCELRQHSALSSPWLPSPPLSPLPLLPGAPPQSVTDWLFVAYLAGAACTALWLAWGWLRLRGALRGAAPVAGERLARIAALARDRNLPLPRRVVESRGTAAPYLMGALRPTLVLPMGWQLDEKVLLHELLHLRYGDVAAGWVCAALRCIHWCNPILWLCFDRMDNDREMLCDQRVLERLEGEDRRDYGRVLLSMADDRRLRVPGATTMANGGQNIKHRIRAIARFKRYPQGMGLVSACILAALTGTLVVGASGLEDPSTPQLPSGDAALFAVAQRTWATTVAGALDAYAKGMYHRVYSPRNALFCRAVIAPPEELSHLYQEYSQTWEARQRDSGWFEQVYRTGPLFRGLTALEEGRWICQVFFFRDVTRQERQDGAEDGLRYLCHTVQVRAQEGGGYTVSLLAQETGALPGETDLVWGEDLPVPPVVWRGQAAGVAVTVVPRQLLTVQGGFVNGQTRSTWNALKPNLPQTLLPDLNARFSSCYGSTSLRVSNVSGRQVQVSLHAVPGWRPDQAAAGNYTANDAGWTGVLAPGERQQIDGSGGGCEFYNGLNLAECLCPDDFTATLAVDGTEYPFLLEREVVVP